MTPGVGVLILAPSPVVRAGLSAMLAQAGDFEVEAAGESSLSGTDVILVADEELLEEAVPDLTADGAQAVILLSEDGRAAARLRALPLRSWGVLPPDSPPEELGAAVLAVARGLIVLSGPLAEDLLDPSADTGESGGPSEPLTARESEVLGLLSAGFSNKMIARELRISEHTVKFHLSSLYEKLGVGNRAEAVSRGARYGLISL